MKAPDKIYLIPFGKPIKEPYPDDDGTTIWSSNPFGNTNAGNIEYIRKEAILKWARECTASFQEQMDYHKETSNAHNILVGGVSTIEMLTSFLESL